MDYFGNIQKLSTLSTDSLHSVTSRLSATRSTTEVIITESANLATKYHVGEQPKALQSWSFNELNKLHIPLVAYYPDDGSSPETLVGVHSGNRLTEWVVTEQDSNQLRATFKKTFTNVIIAVLAFPETNNFSPIVVFANGIFEFVSQIKLDDFVERTDTQISVGEQIISVDGRISPKGKLVLYYVTKNDDSTEKFIVYKMVIAPKSDFSTRNIKPQRIVVKQHIDAWVCCSGEVNTPVTILAVAKKESQIEVYSLERADHDKPVLVLEDSPIDTILAVSNCGDETICVLGQNNNTSTNDVSNHLLMFETKYGTKIGQFDFTQSGLSKDFRILHGNAFITCKNSLIVLPISRQKTTLSQLLTKNLNEANTATKLDNANRFHKMLGVKQGDLIDNMQKLAKFTRKFNSFTKIYGDIPEEFIVSIFDLCTRGYMHWSQLSDDDNVEHTTEERQQALSQLEELFIKLVAMPFNELFIISCLKTSEITFEQSLLGIELLLKQLPSKDCSILTWISALIDSHFRHFIVKPSGEAKATLNRIHEKLNQSIEFYEQLGPIKLLFESVIKRDRYVMKSLTEKAPEIGQYSIELISFH